MRIGILSRGRQNYSTRRLTEAANRLGHRVTLMDPFDCTLYLSAGHPTITHRRRSVEKLDVVIPRLSSATANYGIEVVSHFEFSGVPSANSADAIRLARHKWASLRTLARHGLSVPPSFAAGSVEVLDKAIKRIGGYPFLIKPFQGTQGAGMMLFETPLTAKSALDTLWNLRQDYIAQEFFPEAGGRDLRVLVVGDQVLGAIERIAPPGEFRANVHRGGLSHAVEPTPEIASLARQAAEAIGLGIAGVDMLNLGDRSVVLEVNPSPGFEGFEDATGVNVARAMISYAASLAEGSRRQP